MRWDRTECANGGQVLYSGFASGSRYNEHGGTSDTHCLPRSPQYLSHDTSATHLSTLYGMEIEPYGASPPLRNLLQTNMPCAVCYIGTRFTILTIPAKYTCPTGFTREYYGYMMTELNHASHHRKDTICVDRYTVPIPGLEVELVLTLQWSTSCKPAAMVYPVHPMFRKRLSPVLSAQSNYSLSKKLQALTLI